MVNKKEVKDIGAKIKEMKIELLKQPQKRKSIKKEIARLLTMSQNTIKEGDKK